MKNLLLALILGALAIPAGAQIGVPYSSSGGNASGISGSCAGDLAGTYPNCTVASISNTVATATITLITAGNITVSTLTVNYLYAQHVGPPGTAGWSVSSAPIYNLGLGATFYATAVQFIDGTIMTSTSGFGGGGGTFNGGIVANLSTFQSGVITSTEVVTSTLTVQGGAFSVAASSFVVLNGRIGIGVAAPGVLEDVNCPGSALCTIRYGSTSQNNPWQMFEQNNSFNFSFSLEPAGNSGFVGGSLTSAAVLQTSGPALQMGAQSSNTQLVMRQNVTGNFTTAPIAEFDVRGTTTPAQYVFATSSGTSATTAGTVSFGITQAGHVVSSGTTPSISCTAGTGTMGAHSTDMAGNFSAGTGATACTVTFVTAHSNLTSCVALTNAATPVALSITSLSNSAITITAASALTGDTIYYQCWGAP